MPAMQKWAATVGWALVLAGCGPAPGNDDGSGTSSEGATQATEPTPTGTGTGDPTTGGGTGGLDACDPELPGIAEDEFAERFAAAICAQKLACGCAMASPCEESLVGEFAEIRDHARAGGLTYDGVCAARKLTALVQDRGCSMASELDDVPACAEDCTVYRGDVAAGQSCPHLGGNAFLLSRFIEDCAAPGACDYNYTLVCISLPVVGVGEACRGDSSAEIATCEPGHTCHFEQRKCVPDLGPGDSCAEQSCPSPLVCSQAELCVAPGGTGASCTDKAQCVSQRCGDAGCEDWLWICEVVEATDLFTRNPEVF